MCGRAYETYTDEELHYRYLNKRPLQFDLNLRPNYNFSPTQLSPVVRVQDGERQIDLFRWGLIPAWAKDEKIGYKMINARAETIAEKPSFRSAFKSRRCIVPFSGFIEWKRDGKTKRPFKIFLKDQPIMSVAAIWETWKKSDTETVHSFALITTEANEFMKQIHDRMPVILDRKDEEAWLDPECKDGDALKALLAPCPEGWLEAAEISPLINSPANNRAEVLEGQSQN